jgi:L-ascorbate metabolism protein UlaG (beta-lactamase superfamily)
VKVPFLSDDDFLEAMNETRDAVDTVALWWLGQSGFVLDAPVGRLVFDPYLSDSLTEKYANTDKPHVRITERVVDPGRLTGVDVITSSHQHTDHLDAATIGPLLAANPNATIVVPAANLELAADRLKLPMARLTPALAGERIVAGAFEIHPVPSAHETLEVDAAGRHRFLGYVVRVVDGRSSPVCYHSGDTVLWDGLAEALRSFSLDVALLPINGRAPERRVAGNLDGREAARLALSAGARWVIPCHYDLFEFNTASPDDFVAECLRLAQGHVVLENGQGWILPGADEG